MAKSDKATVLRRVHEVVRLLLAGAEFAEIRQYASAQGWHVCDRQLRRYIEAAYKRLAKTTKRDQDQLLGRHLMQRRAIYARSLKANDLRTALQVLRDEADLEGLYTTSKVPQSDFYPGTGGSNLTRRERLVRLVAAEAAGDRATERLIDHATPRCTYHLPDTMVPAQMLYNMALMYVTEQLEHAGMFLHAVWRGEVEPDAVLSWDLIALTSAYCFRIGREAWMQFNQRMGFDADYLVRSNHQSALLEYCEENICRVAPSAEELKSVIESTGLAVKGLQTAEKLAKSWHDVFAQVCPA